MPSDADILTLLRSEQNLTLDPEPIVRAGRRARRARRGAAVLPVLVLGAVAVAVIPRLSTASSATLGPTVVTGSAGTPTGTTTGPSSDGTLLPPAQRLYTPGIEVVPPFRDGVRPALAGLSYLRGTPVLVWAFGSWCAPCATSVDQITRIAAHGRPAVSVIGLDERDDSADLTAFEDAHALTFTVVADPTGALFAKLAPGAQPAVPQVFLLDREGRLAAQFSGSPDNGTLVADVGALEKETPPPGGTPPARTGNVEQPQASVTP